MEHLLGKKVFIRTVTHNFTGKLRAIGDQELVLDDAAWIADTGSGESGRFAAVLKDGFGKSAEIEPYPAECVVGRGGLVDASEWHHELPRNAQ
jgi:hypothetical protein